ncbi:MAG: glycerophosphodiester phosphodiesterase [Deltaproteobacteria bacterium]|nr:glycerophosphodiester phosphodiesterase [Deltaproteobacteria bacterium]
MRHGRRALAIGMAVGVSVAMGAMARTPRRHIEVQGHRGARGARPENTLAAFRYALALGVDTLELDLQVTRDDVLVVSHDAFVFPARCLGPKGKRLRRPVLIRSLRATEVARYDCGSLRHPRFPEQHLVPRAHLPRFEEVLKLVAKHHRRRHPVELNVETKIVPAYPDRSPTPRRFAALVIAALSRHKLVGRTTLQSFDYRTLRAARRIAPKIRIALLTDGSTTDYVALARRYKAKILSPRHDWITAKDIHDLHRAGVRVIPWTANDAAVWKRLVAAGVDGIITDYPGKLLRFLKARGLH